MEEYLAEIIGAVIAFIMSMAFEWFPGIKDWFEVKTKEQKQMIIGAMALVISVAMFGLNCAGLLGIFFTDLTLTCDIAGGFTMISVFIAVVGAAQTTHFTINRLIHALLKALKK